MVKLFLIILDFLSTDSFILNCHVFLIYFAHYLFELPVDKLLDNKLLFILHSCQLHDKQQKFIQI